MSLTDSTIGIEARHTVLRARPEAQLVSRLIYVQADHTWTRGFVVVDATMPMLLGGRWPRSVAEAWAAARLCLRAQEADDDEFHEIASKDALPRAPRPDRRPARRLSSAPRAAPLRSARKGDSRSALAAGHVERGKRRPASGTSENAIHHNDRSVSVTNLSQCPADPSRIRMGQPVANGVI